MFRTTLCLAISLIATLAAAADLPAGAESGDGLLRLGLLDVTKAPYRADPSGTADSTGAIQQAVNDARDRGLVCFFPEGTYLISDTISCQQQVKKLDQPRHTDAHTQHYWDLPQRIVMFGSTKGRRPVLKLSPDAKGFEDPSRPKIAVWIWAQTRDDAPGKEEPEWGKEQPNISFSHVFKGIDIDVRGHAGAIGIRHSGSQGSTLQDSTIHAEGAYAGMSNCCGQGGGTHNVEVLGGRYGITIDRGSRFPLLNACVFRGQTDAAVSFVEKSQMPTLLVGCLIEPAGKTAVDLSKYGPHAGVSMVDCVVNMPQGGVVCRTTQSENIFVENACVRGAESVSTGGKKFSSPDQWTRIKRYSSSTGQGVNLINGTETSGEIAEWEAAEREPSYETIRRRHYAGTPSFEDADAVCVTSFGAKGDGVADDTEAFRKAIAAADKVFVPKGNFKLTGTLRLRPNTQLFGLTRSFSSIGDVSFQRGRSSRGGQGPSFSIATADDAEAAPGLSFLSVRGRIAWRSGRGTCMLAPGFLDIAGQGGGRFYGATAMGRPFILKGITQPTSFYALNVERVTTHPQSQIRDCSHIRVYFFKVEAGTLNRPNAGDGNTPCRISNSRDVQVYCMYGVVRKLGDQPMLDIVNSEDVVVSQLKTFSPGGFPHLVETNGQEKCKVPSSKTCALFVRDAK